MTQYFLKQASAYANLKTEYYLYPIFILVSYAFLAVFSSHTSPFFYTYGGDSSVFIVLGKSFLSGKIPYVDFFDHKGPVIIFIEALGLQFSSNDKQSIFILQIINLTITQILIYKCARCFTSPLSSSGVVFATLLVFSFTVEGGNMTEEFSLPFLFYSLLITLKVLVHNKKIKSLEIFAVGVFAAILFWLRPNNMNVLCACAIFLIILFTHRKQGKEIVRLIGFAVLGFAAFTLPLIIYFVYIGAFNEMIYAAFTFNLQYSNIILVEKTEPFDRRIIMFVKRGIALIVLAAISAIYYSIKKDRKLLLLSILLLVICYLTTFIGKKYPHYMTLNLPCFVLGVTMLLSLFESTKRIGIRNICFAVSLIALSAYTIGKYNYPYYHETQDDREYEAGVRAVTNIIPKEDFNSVYVYKNDGARFMLIADIPVYFRYFTKQEWHTSHAPHIFEEINTMMKENPPKWIVTDFRNLSTNYDFWLIIDKNYNLQYSSESFQLYRKKL